MAGAALAQTYPERPIRLVVGFAPGGANDIVARILAQKLTENLSQQIVVDNRPGADGAIADTMVAKSSLPDGYTLLLVPASFSYDTVLQQDPPFHPQRDFTAVSLVAAAPFILLANPTFAATNIEGVIALAKTRPGQLTYATGGVGNLTHLAGELFTKMAGISLMPIPYRGTGPALVDLMGGQVPLQMAAILATVPHVASGKVRALGVTSAKRSQVVPDVPTIAESGLAGYEAVGWWAIVAPHGLRKSTLLSANRAIATALASQEVREKMLRQGAEPRASTPEALAAHIDSESKKWSRVIKDANIQFGR
jgi:tripartite-type tricarboxylate transporter receptor subunit TctC